MSPGGRAAHVNGAPTGTEPGDEVLDYRKGVERYQGAEQVVIPGGDHSLQSFPQHLARILEFSRAPSL